MFFSRVENSHIGRPKTNFHRFKSEKQKKKKKKKGEGGSPQLFLDIFLLPFSIFHLPLVFNIQSFLLDFHPFSLFSRYDSKNFPVRSLWGALCPPAPRLLRHWFTLLDWYCSALFQLSFRFFLTIYSII